MSVSKVECTASIRGKGEVGLALFRHLAPLTVSALTREMPISNRVTVYPRAMVCVLTKLRLGVEKQRFEFVKGEVAFLPATGSICFFLADAKSDRPLNPIGVVEAGVDLLSSAGVGDVMEVRMRRDDPPQDREPSPRISSTSPSGPQSG